MMFISIKTRNSFQQLKIYSRCVKLTIAAVTRDYNLECAYNELIINDHVAHQLELNSHFTRVFFDVSISTLNNMTRSLKM